MIYASTPSSSDSDASTGSGITLASSIYRPQSRTEWMDSWCRPDARYQITLAIWPQTPTTRDPALHLQYQPVTLVSLYLIHKRYDFDDTCLLWILTRRRYESSLWTIMSSSRRGMPRSSSGRFHKTLRESSFFDSTSSFKWLICVARYLILHATALSSSTFPV